MLRRSAEATAPDAEARDRMRAKLFEQLAEPEAPTVRPSPMPRSTSSRSAPARSAPNRPAPTRPEPARPKRVTGTRGRLAIALTAAFCLLLALSGMTLFLSRNALPGDPLYGVRRTVESASLGLTMGGEAKGLKHLEFAANRISDVESLAARYPDQANSPVGDYLTAFADFDSDAAAGASDLTGYATTNGPSALTTLKNWAEQQEGRITQVQPGLPPAARSSADQSLALLTRITQRANALAARDDCYTVTSGGSDDLGVLPATGPCDKAPNSSDSTAGSPAAGTVTNQASQAPTAQGGKNGAVPTSRAPVQPPATTTFPTPVVVPPPAGTPAPTTAPGLTLPLPIHIPLVSGLLGLLIGQ